MEQESHDFSKLPTQQEIGDIIKEITASDFYRLSFNKLFRELQGSVSFHSLPH